MKKPVWIVVLTLVASLAGAMPASAARWVQFTPYDPWFWVDLDGVSPRGELTYYRPIHSKQSGVPPAIAGAYFSDLNDTDPHTEDAFNCRTRQHYRWEVTNRDAWMNDETGTVQPNYVFQEDTATWSADVLHAALVTICGSDNPPPAKPQPSEAEQQWLSLAHAVGAGNLKTVKAMLARGINPDTPHPSLEDQFSPLATAVCTGRVDLARLLVANHADINNTENVGNYTPLMFAANCGKTAAIAYLLQAKAKINEKSNKNWTALDFALAKHDAAHRKVAQILLAHGAVSGK